MEREMELRGHITQMEKDETEIRERITALEQDSKSVHRRLDSIERLTACVHEIASETKAMREDMNGLSNRVEEIEKLPKKRYDTVITAIITSLVGVAVGYLLNGGV